METQAALLQEYLRAKKDQEEALEALEKAKAGIALAQEEVDRAQNEKTQYGKSVDTAFDNLTTILNTLEIEKKKPKAAPLHYVVEKLQNISCYYMYIFMSSEKWSASSPKLSILASAVQVEFPNDEQLSFRLELDETLYRQGSTFSIKDDHVYLRLSYQVPEVEQHELQNHKYKNPISSTLSDFTLIQPNETEIQHYQHGLQCRGCKAELLNPNQPLERVFPLPSSNWMDFFSYWGSNGESYDHLSAAQTNGIHAEKARCYLGETSILLHPENLSVAQLAIDEAAETEQGDLPKAKLRCSGCDRIVGHLDTPESYCLEKCEIENSQLFYKYSFDDVLCTDMVEYVHDEGRFGFEIQSLESNVCILLQTLNWDGTLQQHSSDTTSTSNQSPELQPQRVIKLRYQILDSPR